MRKRARAADGSQALSDEDRLRLIKKAFESCGRKPTEEQLRKQFHYETGRGPGESTGRWRGGSKARMP